MTTTVPEWDLTSRKEEWFQSNATFDSPPSESEFEKLDFVKAMLYALQSEQRFLFIGDAGIGKTSFAKWIVESLGFEFVYIPAALISVENMMVPFPRQNEDGENVLKYLFYEHFMTDKPKVVVIDEIGRADVTLGNTLMELLQEGTLAGEEIPGLATVIALDNPQGAEYGRLNGLDFAQADRFATVVLSQSDSPWTRALAAAFPEIDLTRMFAEYSRLSVEIRRMLSPRVLEHMIYAITNGFPAQYALPIMNGEYITLEDVGGNDRTSEVLDNMASALGYPNKAPAPHMLFDAIEAAIRDGVNIFIEGVPGSGKTSLIKQKVAEQKLEAIYLSGPVTQPEDLTIPFPSLDKDGETSTLEMMPVEKLVTPNRKVIIIDEIWRSTRRTANALMEILQERTVGGREIPNLVSCIGINNPREAAGFKLNVGKCDLAQATRFTLSIKVLPSDTRWTEFLFSKYGDSMTPFIEWWEDDLDELGRVLITGRTIERLHGLYMAGLSLEWGKAYVNGEYVAVPLVDLETRLAKQPLARLRQVVAKVDEYEKLLQEGDEANPEAHLAVFTAFSKALLPQLEENRDVCVRLMASLASQHKINLIKPNGPRQKFWQSALLASAPPKKAKRTMR